MIKLLKIVMKCLHSVIGPHIMTDKRFIARRQQMRYKIVSDGS